MCLLKRTGNNTDLLLFLTNSGQKWHVYESRSGIATLPHLFSRAESLPGGTLAGKRWPAQGEEQLQQLRCSACYSLFRSRASSGTVGEELSQHKLGVIIQGCAMTLVSLLLCSSFLIIPAAILPSPML